MLQEKEEEEATKYNSSDAWYLEPIKRRRVTLLAFVGSQRNSTPRLYPCVLGEFQDWFSFVLLLFSFLTEMLQFWGNLQREHYDSSEVSILF